MEERSLAEEADQMEEPNTATSSHRSSAKKEKVHRKDLCSAPLLVATSKVNLVTEIDNSCAEVVFNFLQQQYPNHKVDGNSEKSRKRSRNKKTLAQLEVQEYLLENNSITHQFGETEGDGMGDEGEGL